MSFPTEQVYPGAFAVLCAAILSCGCATSSQSTFEEHAQLAALPAETRAKIQEGIVEPGFTKHMVDAALGVPDRVYRRKTNAGTSIIWSYVKTERKMDRSGLSSSRARRSVQTTSLGRGRSSGWTDSDQFVEFESVRIEFDGDRVRSVEEVKR